MQERGYTILGSLLSLKDAIIAKTAVASILTAIFHSIFGSWLVIEIMIILVFLDLVTGLTRSIKCSHKITSVGLRGTAKKLFLYLALIIAAHQVVRLSDLFTWFEGFIATFLAITEVLSIIENLSQAGIIVPRWVVEKLHKYLNTGDFK